jgi:hypothetical protein
MRPSLPEIYQSYLKHAIDRHPAIGLMQMVMEGFDGPGETERGRNLAAAGGKLLREAPAEALHFEEISALLGINGEGLDGYTSYEFR